jgi:hypothetical protein
MTGNIMNFSLFSGSDGDVLSRVLCGQPDMTLEVRKPKELLKHDN